VPGIYIGEDRHVIDPKGRINIPARHRRTAAEFGSKLFVAPGFAEECLVIYDQDGFRDLARRIRESGAPEDVTWAMREIFSQAVDPEPDDQGRIVIPELLRSYAHLTRDVLLKGVNDRLEAWDPEHFAARRASNPLSLVERAKKLLLY
jgi:MraZ protein